jgi:3-oxoacyl-[acyl-carrier-protein] synthase II
MSTSSPIAIIGMSCRAAGVETLADLWDMSERAERRFRAVPPDRWYGLEPGVALPKPPQASLLERIDEFDARFFGIAPRMAAWMDPQHRMLLELAWHTVENAGLDPDALAGEPVAVFVGTLMSDYRERMNAMGKTDGAAFPGTLTSFMANRVSYQFEWTGPSMVIDSACSSGLTALGLAVRGLQNGDYPMALVGAPNIISNGFYANTAYRGGALSPSGDSIPFSVARDGYVRGEGGACVLLKPLQRALEDGDPVHAVIRAVGTAHNGRGGGLTGTDAESQVRLMRRTVELAEREIGDLGYVEAHGSGTPGGDAVEVAALARALRNRAARPAGPDGKVWVGSIKANIGHLEGASGLIGLVKAALVVKNGRIPRIAGLTAADPELPIDGAPVAIAVEHVSWPASGSPRLAAVNSFGLGGSLSQVLIEESTTGRPSPSPQDRNHVIPLSAEDESSIATLADRLVRELDGLSRPDLPAIAWTMQTGRRAQRTRRTVVARDVEGLLSALRDLAAGTPDPHSCEGDEAPLVKAWLDGEPVDWSPLWSGSGLPVRANLPGTPFVRRSHWFDKQPPS